MHFFFLHHFSQNLGPGPHLVWWTNDPCDKIPSKNSTLSSVLWPRATAMPKTTAKDAVANAIQQPKGNEGQQMSVPTVPTNIISADGCQLLVWGLVVWSPLGSPKMKGIGIFRDISRIPKQQPKPIIDHLLTIHSKKKHIPWQNGGWEILGRLLFICGEKRDYFQGLRHVSFRGVYIYMFWRLKHSCMLWEMQPFFPNECGSCCSQGILCVKYLTHGEKGDAKTPQQS